MLTMGQNKQMKNDKTGLSLFFISLNLQGEVANEITDSSTITANTIPTMISGDIYIILYIIY